MSRKKKQAPAVPPVEVVRDISPTAEPALPTASPLPPVSSLSAGGFTRLGAVVVLILLLAVAAVYAPVVGYPFVTLDDPQTVSANPQVQRGLTADSIVWAFTEIRTFYWQPLTWLSHMCDVQLFGQNAGGHHAVNVLIHGLNVVLVFLVLLRLSGAFWRSAFVAALFAVHPLRVESVAWVAERKDVLSGFFCLLAVWFYIAYARGQSTRRNYLLMLAAGVAAMMSKPMAVSLPVALLLLDSWPLQRLTSRAHARPLLLEKLPLLLMAALVAVLTLLGNVGNSLSFGELPLAARVATFLISLLAYLAKLLWPFPLAVFYPYGFEVSLLAAIASACLITLAFLIAIVQRRAMPALLAGLLWFVLWLLPVSGLFQTGGQSMADRFTYLPSLGIFVALVFGVGRLVEGRGASAPYLAGAAGALVLIALGVLSWFQVGTWRDSITLYRHAIAVTTDNEPMMRNLATELSAQGQYEEAIRYMREAIRIEPNRLGVQYDLALMLQQAGRAQESLQALTRAVQQQPDSLVIRKALAMALLRAGRTAEASLQFHLVLRYAPNDMLARQMTSGTPPPDNLDSDPTAQTDPPVHRPDDSQNRPEPVNIVEFWQSLLVLLCVALAVLAPGFGKRHWERGERLLQNLAHRRTLSIVVVGLLPLLIRLALLPIYDVPQAAIADEFGYLLTADTFAHGRLANAPHMMREFLESSYILFEPNYTSYYPIGQSVVLLLPKLLGVTPWLGVWASVGLMCAALCWMLQAWLPPRWALIGALVGVFQYGIFGYWMNSYWGGAMPALGGALTLGALPRLFRTHKVRDAIWFGLGLLLLSQTRPYEGVALAIPVCLALVFVLARQHEVAWSKRLLCVVLPIGAILCITVAGTLYYNHAVTGDPLKLPYRLYQEQWGMPTSFYWQPALPETAILSRYPDIRDNYLWQREIHDRIRSFWGLSTTFLIKNSIFWHFYLGPALTLPLLLLPWVARRRKLRLLIFTGATALLAIALYPFYFAHYMAPVAGILLVIMMCGLRYLRTWQWSGQPTGVFLVRGLLMVVLTTVAIPAGFSLLTGIHMQTKTARGDVIQALQKINGSHLVLVRYRPWHNFHNGPIYNDADIDGSPIVWARDLGLERNRKLLRYFNSRKVWLFEPDLQPPQLAPYDTETGAAKK